MRILKKAALLAAGVALALALATTEAQAQRGMGRGDTQMRRMHGDVPGVQLTDQQRQRITAIRQQTQAEVQRIRRDQSLTPQQREQRIEAAQREAHQQIMDILTPDQRAQFQTWWAQRSRVAGYRGGAAAEAGISGDVPGVTLSEEQREQVREIRREAQARVQEIRRDQNLTDQQRNEQIAAAQRAAHERVMEVLSPEQRAQFDRWWLQRSQRMGGRQ